MHGSNPSDPIVERFQRAIADKRRCRRCGGTMLASKALAVLHTRRGGTVGFTIPFGCAQCGHHFQLEHGYAVPTAAAVFCVLLALPCWAMVAMPIGWASTHGHAIDGSVICSSAIFASIGGLFSFGAVRLALHVLEPRRCAPLGR
ncbi:MAG: hypothetical protein J0L92_18350 [Deltaproteobacteria bacterium]|nr:hypothetical protein [Deltaproteobacteria bacterium]